MASESPHGKRRHLRRRRRSLVAASSVTSGDADDSDPDGWSVAHVFWAVMPPSTLSTEPLMNEAPGRTSDQIAWATSAGSP